VVGTVPDYALARSVFSRAASSVWTDLPASVTALSAVNPAGERFWFIHNWSGSAVSVEPPKGLSSGDRLELAPRDVRVVKEERA
jgi:beta-galactosidase